MGDSAVERNGERGRGGKVGEVERDGLKKVKEIIVESQESQNYSVTPWAATCQSERDALLHVLLIDESFPLF